MLENNGGSVVFTSSVIGNTVAMPNKAAYAAGKAGLVGLVQALAVEYGQQKIRFNALVPGAVITPMADQLGSDPETIAFIESLHVLKRRAEPEELAQSALYLASDLSSFTTGTAMVVDGGVSICKT